MKWPTHDEVLSRENFVILWLLLMARDFFFRDNYSCKVVLNSQVTCIIPLQYGQKKTGKRGALFSLGNLAFLYCLYAIAFYHSYVLGCASFSLDIPHTVALQYSGILIS